MVTATATVTPTMPTAAAWPSCWLTNARRYKSITKVLVAPMGPPCVSSQIRSKRRNDQMVENSVSKVTDGLMVGQTTALNTLRLSAPSMTAASRSSWGTPCNAARMTTAANGKICQTVAMRMAGNAKACCPAS